jgi:hypothetical protein
MHPELSPVISHIRFDEHARSRHTPAAVRVSPDHRFFRRRRWGTAPPGRRSADVVVLGSRRGLDRSAAGERVA